MLCRFCQKREVRKLEWGSDAFCSEECALRYIEAFSFGEKSLVGNGIGQAFLRTEDVMVYKRARLERKGLGRKAVGGGGLTS